MRGFLSVDGFMRSTSRRLLEGLADQSDRYHHDMDRRFHRAPEKLGRAETAAPNESRYYPYWEAWGGERPGVSHYLKAAERKREVAASRPKEEPELWDGTVVGFEGYRHATCGECEVVFWRQAEEPVLCPACTILAAKQNGAMGRRAAPEKERGEAMKGCYFVFDAHFLRWKIGASTDVAARFRALVGQLGRPDDLSLVSVIPAPPDVHHGDVDQESRAHAVCEDDRITNEWYAVSPRTLGLAALWAVDEAAWAGVVARLKAAGRWPGIEPADDITRIWRGVPCYRVRRERAVKRALDGDLRVRDLAKELDITRQHAHTLIRHARMGRQRGRADEGAT